MASEAMIEFTDSNFDAEVLQADVPVLVDFGATWCQPCKMLAPVIHEIAGEYDGKAKVGEVDIDSNQQVAVKYGIRSVPTVMIFKNGEMTKQFVGLTAKDQITAALDAAL
jgi:thioredoxin 1